jgi:hypothetical protein
LLVTGRGGALGLEAEALVGPAGDEPAHVAGDGVDVLEVLLDGIGIVEAQVALSVLLARDAEVQADRLGVADVQVAVGLGREARDDLGVALLGDVAATMSRIKSLGAGAGASKLAPTK